VARGVDEGFAESAVGEDEDADHGRHLSQTADEG
jgi:hypothetical protein